MIAFVDSDDWIEPDFIKIMHDSILDNDVDCAMCGVYNHAANGLTYKRVPDFSERILKAEIIREGLLIPIERKNWYLFSYLWDKVFRKGMWDEVKFDETLICDEDRVAIYRCFDNKRKLLTVQECLYHYRCKIGVTTRENVHFYNYLSTLKILEIAELNNYELTPIYESLCVNSLGYGRECAKNKNWKEFDRIAKNFKKIYPYIQANLKKSNWAEIKYGGIMLYYMPYVLYCCLCILNAIRAY